MIWLKSIRLIVKEKYNLLTKFQLTSPSKTNTSSRVEKMEKHIKPFFKMQAYKAMPRSFFFLERERYHA